ncbi:FAD-binding oxidoreductase [Actinokineospora sp. UTMC 2448]|uniref:FAD-binding oxidoreductase n=1 Tax=Actinokineospora sp. UTMC 2448 TaxID=2268449 RepID=UPI002164472B|nr:FAD-binding protein [Actinokineospora sp. UTMC 2448]UVS79660.1 Mitomycin radical oxidase [Actinokineospora sp. UTMC 2448]
MSTFEGDGPIAGPGSPEFDAATRTFNLAAPAAPAAAVTATTVAEVRAAVEHAAARGLRVRAHTTGHAAATFGPMDDALLVRTELGGGVEVDAEAKTARLPAGTRWGAVVEATTPHGLVSAHGTSPTVGVVGYLLRGGVSFYGRLFGMATNTIRAIELVTADGAHRRVDAESDPDLFWALRGGGGGFGVVTAVEIALFPVTSVITGAAFWRAEHAAEIVARWHAWTATAPEAASTSLRLMNLPPLPGRPEAISSGPVVCLDGAIVDGGSPSAREVYADLLDPLRSVANPVLDTWRETTPDAVPSTHMDPPNPVLSMGDHLLVDGFDAQGVAEFLRVAGPGSPLLAAELRQLGGALAVPDPAGGVLNHVSAQFMYQCVGSAIDPPTLAASRERAALIRSTLAPWDTGRTIPGFVGSHDQPQGHLDTAQIEAVDRVRARIDPDGLFRGDITPNATKL